MKGFMVLTAIKAGTYTPGMENALSLDDTDKTSLDKLTQQLIVDYNRLMHRQA